MPLERLKLTDFRSYAQREFELGPRVNLVVGPNASGKTNLLESLYVLATTKSFRAKERDLVRHQQEVLRVAATAGRDEMALSIALSGGRVSKQVTYSGVKKTLAAHVGQLPAVLFEPGDIELASGPPSGRRRYLDLILCQSNPEYLRSLTRYRHVLKQRNALLANFQTERIKDEIFAWDVKLTELAIEIVQRRLELIEHLNRLSSRSYGDIAGGEVELAMVYVPSVEGEYGERFMDTLARRLPGDLAAGFTTIGPHREDFAIQFKGSSIEQVASRGETRTVVLALKLAELSYFEERLGRTPLLLLDDVFSELDAKRRHHLVARLDGYQTFITTTDAEAIEPHLAEYQLITTGGARV